MSIWGKVESLPALAESNAGVQTEPGELHQIASSALYTFTRKDRKLIHDDFSLTPYSDTSMNWRTRSGAALHTLYTGLNTSPPQSRRDPYFTEVGKHLARYLRNEGIGDPDAIEASCAAIDETAPQRLADEAATLARKIGIAAGDEKTVWIAGRRANRDGARKLRYTWIAAPLVSVVVGDPTDTYPYSVMTPVIQKPDGETGLAPDELTNGLPTLCLSAGKIALGEPY